MTFHPKKSLVDSWICRASSLGKLIPASGKVTQTWQSYIQEQYTQKKWSVKKDISSKYFEKGVSCEQSAIDLLNRSLFPGVFINTYKIQVHNEYVSGTPDIVTSDFVIDIKNAYDVFTFDRASLSHEYMWQVKAYLWLTGRKNGFIFYALVDMPDHLFADEERRLFYNGKFLSYESSDFLKASEELRKRYIYTGVEDTERFKLFPVTLEEKDPETIMFWVEKAREYMQKLHKEDLDNRNQNFMLQGGFTKLEDLFNTNDNGNN